MTESGISTAIKRIRNASLLGRTPRIALACLLGVALYFAELAAQTTPAPRTRALQSDSYFRVESMVRPEPYGINLGHLFDYDSDGDLDWLSHFQEWEPPKPAPMVVFRNDGQGNFTEATASAFDGPIPEFIMVENGAVADFNGDGLMDIYIADGGPDNREYDNHATGGQNGILIQTPGGQLRDETATRLPQEIAFTHFLTAGDIDGDSDIDIYNSNIRCYSDVGPRLYINDGAGYFAPDTTSIPYVVAARRTGYIYNVSRFLDVDRDGDLDLVLGATADVGERDVILMNDGRGNFTFAPETSMPPRFGGSPWATLYADTADFNHDGWPDLVMTLSDSYSSSGNCSEFMQPWA